MNLVGLQQQFIDKYGDSDQPVRVFFAPGRVNLIGDHTDYNGGLVFPCAIDYGNTLLIRRCSDNAFKLASTNFDLLATLSKEQTNQKYGDHWVNYPLGVLQQFLQAGHNVDGFECLYSGDVPNAAGLSSSAAIEVVTAFAINELFACKIDLLSLVKLSQRAENQFVGVQCGIMDQFAVAMAQANHAMKLNCQTLECEQTPLDLDSHGILLINTNQRRELSETGYNERVDETQQALALLRNVLDVNELADVSPDQLSKHAGLFTNQPVIMQRARHVVTENDRVIRAVDALRQQNLTLFGQLMFESHVSLRDDYGVSSGPLDTLVKLARNCSGVLGARLTGAGFGGCTVNLINKSNVEGFIAEVTLQYQQQTGLSADFYTVQPSQGVREVTP